MRILCLGKRLMPLYVSIVFLMNLLGWGFNYVRQRYSARTVHGIVFDIREQVTKQTLNQDMSFFDKYPTGKIVSRINSDSDYIGQTVILVLDSSASLLAVVVLLVPLFSIDFALSLIFLVVIPSTFSITLLFRKVARQKTLEGQRALATVDAFTQETMSGIQIAKTFSQEPKLYSQFKKVNNQSFLVNRTRAYYLNLIFPMLSIVNGLMTTLLVFVGGWMISSGQGLINTDLVLFVYSIAALFWPIFQLATFWPQFQTGLAATERIYAIIDSTPVVSQNDDHKFDLLRGEIEFQSMHFEYTSDKPVFHDFSLSIKPGESVAIVGHTGAGKSSLARLILRFYEFQDGHILVDKHDNRSLNLESYRKKIGFIPQTPFLWSDTLENNVKYGVPDATREEVLWALDQAGGNDWVEDLPQGLDTNIRERGKLLSIGQRQLVVFARVLLQNPSISILDEATASVDPFTETRIQEATEKIMKERTSIIIAHRLRTITHVNRILVLDHGRIVEEGSHKSLMLKGGTYSTLYTKYFQHQSYDYLEKKITIK
ncbi:MAG: ABC transporter ATP-binding protein [Promethearchaeota archaeon]